LKLTNKRIRSRQTEAANVYQCILYKR